MTQSIGRAHREMIDGLADFQVVLLRYTYRNMAREDFDALAAVEGITDFHRVVASRFRDITREMAE